MFGFFKINKGTQKNPRLQETQDQEDKEYEDNEYEVINDSEVFVPEQDMPSLFDHMEPAQQRVMSQLYHCEDYPAIKQYIYDMVYFDVLQIYLIKENGVQYTILHKAVIHKDSEFINYIIRHSTKEAFSKALSCVTTQGENVLHLLFNPLNEKNKTLDKFCVESIMLFAGPEGTAEAIQMQTVKGETPLALALQMKDSSSLKALLEYSDTKAMQQSILLLTATQKNIFHIMVQQRNEGWKVEAILAYLTPDEKERFFLQKDSDGLMPLEYGFSSYALFEVMLKISASDTNHQPVTNYVYTSTSILLAEITPAYLLDQFCRELLKDKFLGPIKIYLLTLFNCTVYNTILRKIKQYPSRDDIRQTEQTELFVTLIDEEKHQYPKAFIQCLMLFMLLEENIKDKKISWSVISYLMAPDPALVQSSKQDIVKKGSLASKQIKALDNIVISFTPRLFKAVETHLERTLDKSVPGYTMPAPSRLTKTQ